MSPSPLTLLRRRTMPLADSSHAAASRWPRWLVAGLLAAGCCGPAIAEAADFGREVRPILAKHCLTCHGPDEATREAGLRLDTAEGAYADLGGYRAVEPGDPEASELILRVTHDDPDLRMPPADSHPPLSDQEIATLREWIDEGAAYSAHWAFEPPRQPDVPEVSDPSWCRSPIDRFVLARLDAAGLRPAAEADRATMIRRLSLDLVGLLPTPEQVERFVSDADPLAYRRLVDRLLASPAYAERFARPWLDLARYSDTNGYEKDRPRTIWPYRDWVIDAIAADMPYDQFSVEQLAGDMLPRATASQRIATGFHRNTMLNEEGGIDPLEYRFHALVDRVATTGTVWMGLTVGCAQCHTHKYDPITHRDYYQLMALLNGADEPEMEVPDRARESERRALRRRIDEAERRLVQQHLPDYDAYREGISDGGTVTEAFADFLSEQLQAARPWQVLRPSGLESTMPKLTVLDDGSILASGDVTKRDVYRLRFDLPTGDRPLRGLRVEVLPHESLPAGGPGMAYYEGRRGDFFLSELDVRVDGREITLADASHSYGNISVGSGTAEAANVIDNEGSTGWSTAGAEGEANRLVVRFAEPVDGSGTLEVEMLFERHFAAALGRFRVAVTSGQPPLVASRLSAEVQGSIADAGATGQPLDRETYRHLQRHFVRHHESLSEARRPIERLRRSLPEPVRTFVMKERPPEDRRVTHRHHRGEYLQPKEVVRPDIPAMFGSLGTESTPTRLDLARWLVSPDNPLVGRVTVNRGWRQFFGTGLVRTAGDFGTQSESPTHPELLDWLALDWMQSGWSMKRLHRQIVLSATYRQAVGPAPDSDPDHRLLSAMPYRRLDAERVRDAMLSASGLLCRQIGGPSVYPPQPASVTAMAYGSPKWTTSTGGDRYRRSLYTFSKRTAPFAAYATFDGPTGEVCLARRDRSTTPLQALTLLNDEMFLELARGLAKEVLRDQPQAGAEAIVEQMFLRVLSRHPDDQERQAVSSFYRRQLSRSRQNDSKGSPADAKLHAWTLVARALMNTDEAITTP